MGIYATLEAVTRTAVRLLFVAMLALLAAQGATVPVHGACQYESVCKPDAVQEQQAPFDLQHECARRQPLASAYESLLLSEHDFVLLFQLPPPVFSLAS